MKKFICILLSVIMCFALSITTYAETQELIFPMATTEGSVIFKGVAGFNCNVEPDVVAEDFIILKETGEMPALTNVKLLVTGDKGRSYVENAEYQFINYYDALCTERARDNEGMYWKLNIAKDVAYLGDFLADSYSRIYTIAIEVEGKMTVAKEEDYTKWANNSAIEGLTFNILKGFTYGGYITDTIEATTLSVNKFEYTTKSVRYDFPFIGSTDANGDGIITRDEVLCLSYSALGKGEGVFGFEGLASQTADFFNKKDNGKITFHVTTAPATYSTVWSRSKGGVPSNQIGLTNGFGKVDGLIGLFINYDRTGSLVTTSTVDADGNAEFDITDILNDIGGNSIATIHSIYYGLVGGYTYTNELIKGFKVDRVTLSYTEEDEEMVAECEIVEDVEEEVVVDVSDEDSEEVEEEEEEPAELDEEEVEIEIEPEEVSEEPEIEIVTDANAVTVADEDTNPGTGVSLVTIPAAISAIAVLTLRKRK